VAGRISWRGNWCGTGPTPPSWDVRLPRLGQP